jgi:hypothetical protein
VISCPSRVLRVKSGAAPMADFFSFAQLERRNAHEINKPRVKKIVKNGRFKKNPSALNECAMSKIKF